MEEQKKALQPKLKDFEKASEYHEENYLFMNQAFVILKVVKSLLKEGYLSNERILNYIDEVIDVPDIINKNN